MNWQSIIQQFLNHLQKERNASANTVMAYRNDLLQFAEYLARNFPVSAGWADVQPETITHYTEMLAASGYTSSTVARKVAAMKTLLSWLKQHTAHFERAGNLRPFCHDRTHAASAITARSRPAGSDLLNGNARH
jgi:site-specific recombinase XerD